MKLNPILIITILYLLAAFTLLVLMGMEIISNRAVTDRLLLTIPVTGALIMAYWFSRTKKNGDSPGV